MSKAKSAARHGKQLKALKTRVVSAGEIRDIPEMHDWDGAVRGRFYRPVKKAKRGNGGNITHARP